MNDIPECNSLFLFLLYADDTSPMRHIYINDGDSSYSPISIINTELAKVNDWLAVHYCDVLMGAEACQITSLMIVYSTVYSDTDQRKHQSSASLAFVRGIHGGPVNFPHKWPITRKMFPFDNVIMEQTFNEREENWKYMCFFANVTKLH